MVRNRPLTKAYEVITSNKTIILIDKFFVGHEKIVELLIRGGAKIDIEDIQQNTPLHLAATGNFWVIFRHISSKFENNRNAVNSSLS